MRSVLVVVCLGLAVLAAGTPDSQSINEVESIGEMAALQKSTQKAPLKLGKLYPYIPKQLKDTKVPNWAASKLNPSLPTPAEKHTTVTKLETKPDKPMESKTWEVNTFNPSKVLLVAVCTAPDHIEHREAIRRTWRKLMPVSSHMDYDVFFFIGKIQTPNETHDMELEARIRMETNAYQDIVRLDSFVEHYNNLTRKTLGMIQWAAAMRYQVMMKVDDDTFVLLDNVYYDIIAYDPDRVNLYWGKFWGSDDRPVDRVIGSKFYVSETEYPHPTYPNYADGPCYALGRDLLKWVDQHAATLPIYRLEDAAVGIWLSQATTLPYREVFGDAYMYQRHCPEGLNYYWVNPVTPSEMDDIMKRYANREDICSRNFSLSVCDDPQRGCLCSPCEHPCWDRPDYMSNMLLQSEAQTVPHMD